jgi:hypothetical protein
LGFISFRILFLIGSFLCFRRRNENQLLNLIEGPFKRVRMNLSRRAEELGFVHGPHSSVKSIDYHHGIRLGITEVVLTLMLLFKIFLLFL